MITIEDTNVCVLVARLTSDPELRALASGTSLCSLRVAYNTSQKDAGGQWEDKGNFINVTIWGSHGETCAKYLTKGSKVAINGRLGWREWDSEHGKRSETSITANRVQFLDSKQEGQGVSAQPGNPANAPVDNEDIPF